MKKTTKKQVVLICVVEDDKYYADIFAEKLAEEGYEVIIAEDGEQAIKKIKHHRPDLVLLDLILPVKDGFQVLKEVRSDESLHKVIIIVVSNLGQDEDVERARKLGANDYLIKANTTVKEIIEKVKSSLPLKNNSKSKAV